MHRSVSVLLLFVPFPVFGQTAEQKQATIKYLQNLQQADGGFIAVPQDPKSDPPPRSSLRATSAAVRALKYFGGSVPKPDAAAIFAKSCFDAKTGGFSDTPQGKPEVFLTAVGLMAVVELKLPAEPYTTSGIGFLTKNAKGFEEIRIAVAGFEAVKQFPPEIKPWLKSVEEMRNADGSYGKGENTPRMTGSAVALILRSGGTISDEHRKGAIEVLKKGQRADGGYGKEEVKTSDLETTYRVMRAFHLLKEKPADVAKLREYIGKCRNADGGYGVEPGKPSAVGSTYYAAIILHWLDAK